MATWPAHNTDPWDTLLRAYIDAGDGAIAIRTYNDGWPARGTATVVIWVGGTIDVPPPGIGSDIWLRDVA